MFGLGEEIEGVSFVLVVCGDGDFCVRIIRGVIVIMGLEYRGEFEKVLEVDGVGEKGL